MDWRRWDSLEQQSKPIIRYQHKVQPKESLTRRIRFERLKVGSIADMPTRTEAFTIYVDNSGPNLDPFRTERSEGWLTNEQYAALLAQRAVLQ